MRHVLHIAAVTVAAGLALVPASALTPAITDFVANHPGAAAYLAVATALLTTVVKALAKAATGASAPPPPPASPGAGSETMGAK